MKILLSPDEVNDAICSYIGSDLILNSDSRVTLGTNGGAEILIGESRRSFTPEVEKLSNPRPDTIVQDPFAEPVNNNFTQETAANVVNDSNPWDRDNWIKLRKAGFIEYVQSNFSTLGLQAANVMAAVKEKWENLYDNPFPGDSEPEPTVGAKITEAAGGDVKEQLTTTSEELDPFNVDENVPVEPELEESDDVFASDIDSGATIPAEMIPETPVEETESLFG